MDVARWILPANETCAGFSVSWSGCSFCLQPLVQSADLLFYSSIAQRNFWTRHVWATLHSHFHFSLKPDSSVILSFPPQTKTRVRHQFGWSVSVSAQWVFQMRRSFRCVAEAVDSLQEGSDCTNKRLSGSSPALFMYKCWSFLIYFFLYSSECSSSCFFL